MNDDPHRDTPVRQFGSSIEDADGVVILLHGRGGSADDILSLAREFDLPQLAYLAPQAAGNSWYPNSFLTPRAQNEPWLTSALNKVAATMQIAETAGFSTDQIVIGGFSQGACLSTEFVATHPQRYGGLIAFTGGLIGPLGANLAHAGDLAGTPAFFGSGDPDPHVPWQRVEQSAQILQEMGAVVSVERYPHRPHTVSADEIARAQRLLSQVFSN
jgi:phospholipase/carboxylesterase